MRLDLRHVRHFLMLADTLHFRRSAARLNIAQPALSRSIRNLEAEIGVELFRRTRRFVELTEAGAVLAREWRGVLEKVERGGRRAQRAALGVIGTLRLAYTDFAIAGELPRVIQAYAETAPGVEIDTRHAVTWRQIESLEEGEIDVGFLTGPISHPKLNTLLVQEERCVLIVPKRHRLGGRSSVRLADLAAEPFVLGEERDWRHFHVFVHSECRKAGFEPRVVQRAYNSVGIFGLVASGMGVTLHSETARNLLHPDLVALPVVDFQPLIQTVAAWLSDTDVLATQAFVRFLAERYPRRSDDLEASISG